MGLLKWFTREHDYAQMVYRRRQLTRVIEDANVLQDTYNAQHKAMMAISPDAGMALRDMWHAKVDEILLKARKAIVDTQAEIKQLEDNLRKRGRV